MIERLGTQKHKCALGELELKCRKLENKAMEKQHQREHEREQHKIRMMQMRMMMTQNQQATAMWLPMMMQAQNVTGPWDERAYACSCTKISSGTGHGLLTDDCLLLLSG